jgi:molybdopterin-guanine dinucleotide biosynthesis protein B
MERGKVLERLPGLDCGDCGFEGCAEMAEEIAEGRKILLDCVVIKAGKKVEIRVGDCKIPVGSFVQGFVAKTVLGMISSLKKTKLEAGDIVELRIRVDEDDIR